MYIYFVEANKRVCHKFDILPFIYVVNIILYFVIWNKIKMTIVRD